MSTVTLLKSLSELHVDWVKVEKDLVKVPLSFGTRVFDQYEEWALQQNKGPNVYAIFIPPSNVVPPPAHLLHQLMIEVMTIISHYSTLHLHEETVELPLVNEAPQDVNYTRPIMALSALMKRIQNVEGERYVALTSLRSGSFICNVRQTWQCGIIISVNLFKS